MMTMMTSRKQQQDFNSRQPTSDHVIWRKQNEMNKLTVPFDQCLERNLQNISFN